MKHKYIKGAGYIELLLCLLFSTLLIFLIELSNRESFFEVLNFYDKNPRVLFLSLIIITSIIIIINFIFRKIYLSCLIALIISTIVGFINISKIKYQGLPFVPWDIFLFKDAARVMPAMKNEFINAQSVTFFIVALVLLFFVFLLYKIWDKRLDNKYMIQNKLSSISSVCVIILCICILTGLSTENKNRVDFFDKNNIVNYFWDQNFNYVSNGFIVGFTINMSNIMIKKPYGYSESKILEIGEVLKNYQDKNSSSTPDIIVIMSESFADLTSVKGLGFSKDPLSNFREIGEKGVSGDLYVPVVGGKTANTEFEFLTGYSVKHLPESSVPYQQYIKNDINSLARILKKKNYKTTAIHNNTPEFWSRDKVYKYMGFDKFISVKDFKDPFYFDNWMSDKDMMNKIKETLESNEKSKQFIFAITVQNHAPYYVPGYVEEVSVKGDASKEDKETLSRYATGINISDKELASLYEYIKDRKKPTILCYFGDHMPGGFSIYKTLPYYIDVKKTDTKKELFTTPYLIWSNYKEKPQEKNIGVNALSGCLLDYADMEVPGFYGYINSKYDIQVNEDQVYFNMNSLDNSIRELKSYEYLIMYDDIFGKKYNNE